MSNAEIIKNISSGWSDYRSYCLDKSSTGASIRKIKIDHPFYDLFTNTWKKEIESKVDTSKYKIQASLGEGNLAAVPWLAILNKTITDRPSKGWYLVYLYSRSAEKLYLTMGLGSFQFLQASGQRHFTRKTLLQIETATKKFKKIFSHHFDAYQFSKIDLIEDQVDFETPLYGSSRSLVKSYEKGTCFGKQYIVKDVSDNELLDDLNNYTSIYEEIIKDPLSESIDFLSEDVIEDKNLKPEKLYYIPSFVKREKREKNRKSKINSNFNFKRKTQESRKVGLAGENYVFEYECLKLKEHNLSHLINSIEKHFEKGEYPGWDITSFDERGNEIFIEVKSTKGKVINNLEITENEWNAAKKERKKYFIYLVTNALNDKIQISEKINNPKELVENSQIEILPSVYKLEL